MTFVGVFPFSLRNRGRWKRRENTVTMIEGPIMHSEKRNVHLKKIEQKFVSHKE